jgi:hypothetical protein
VESRDVPAYGGLLRLPPPIGRGGDVRQRGFVPRRQTCKADCRERSLRAVGYVQAHLRSKRATKYSARLSGSDMEAEWAAPC